MRILLLCATLALGTIFLPLILHALPSSSIAGPPPPTPTVVVPPPIDSHQD